MALAPVYDMLPMSFAPSGAGSLRTEAVDIKVDATVNRNAWEFVLPLAETFWLQVADDARISAGFRQIARAMLEKLTLAGLVIQRLA